MNKILVLGFGNPGRGDDGLGPALIDCLEGQVPSTMGISYLTAMQLQPEHVLDLETHELGLFIDAGMGTPSPFSFERILPRRDASFSTHALSPYALLSIYRDILGREPPPTFLLTILGEHFVLEEPLSTAARRRLEQAVFFVTELLANPCPVLWQQACCGVSDARTVPG